MWKEGDAKLQSYFSEESKKICYNTFIKYHDDPDRIAKIGLALGGKRSRRKFLKFFQSGTHIFTNIVLNLHTHHIRTNFRSYPKTKKISKKA